MPNHDIMRRSKIYLGLIMQILLISKNTGSEIIDEVGEVVLEKL